MLAIAFRENSVARLIRFCVRIGGISWFNGLPSGLSVDPFQNQFNRPSPPPLPSQGGQTQQSFVDANYPVPDRFSNLNQQTNGTPQSQIGSSVDFQPKKKGLFGRS